MCCARTRVDSRTRERLQHLAAGRVDWPSLIELASYHQLRPLLHRNLAKHCPAAVPELFLERLSVGTLRNAQSSLFLVEKQAEIARQLADRDILAVFYKGAFLAISAYGDVGLREFTDIDVLVAERDYSRAKNNLIALGYRPSADYEYECSLVDESQRVCIDLHRAVTPPEFPVAVDFRQLWQRLQSISTGGVELQGPSPEDHLVLLCARLSADVWANKGRLAKITDIHEMVGSSGSMDWYKVVGMAKRARASRMLQFSLQLARDLLGTSPPESAMDLLGHSSANELASHLTSVVLSRIEKPPERPPTKLPMLKRHLCHAPLVYKTKARRWWLRTVTPNDRDRTFVRLPEDLSALYYLVRPVRLTLDVPTRFLRGRWRRRA